MKWTKVSLGMLDAYKAFVDVFLNCQYTRLYHLKVRKRHDWTAFGRSENARFFKAYYVFLRMHMRSHSRYVVQVDDKPGKRYRWSQVYYAINAAAARDYGVTRKQIADFRPMDSKRSDLLQLVDVVLGAMTSVASAPAKLNLLTYVRDRVASREAEVKSGEWSPTVVAKSSSALGSRTARNKR